MISVSTEGQELVSMGCLSRFDMGIAEHTCAPRDLGETSLKRLHRCDDDWSLSEHFPCRCCLIRDRQILSRYIML